MEKFINTLVGVFERFRTELGALRMIHFGRSNWDDGDPFEDVVSILECPNKYMAFDGGIDPSQWVEKIISTEYAGVEERIRSIHPCRKSNSRNWGDETIFGSLSFCKFLIERLRIPFPCGFSESLSILRTFARNSGDSA